MSPSGSPLPDPVSAHTVQAIPAPTTDPANTFTVGAGQEAGIGEIVSVTPAVTLVSGTVVALEVAEGAAVPGTDPANHTGQVAGIGEIVGVTSAVTLITGTAVALEVAEGAEVILITDTDPANDLCRTVGARQAVGLGEIANALEVAKADGVYDVCAWCVYGVCMVCMYGVCMYGVCVYQSCVWCVCSGHSRSVDIHDLAGRISDLQAAQVSAAAAQASAFSEIQVAQSVVKADLAALKAKVTTDASSPTSNVAWVQKSVQQYEGEWKLMVDLETQARQDMESGKKNEEHLFIVQLPHRPRSKTKRKAANPTGENNWVQPLWSKTWVPALNKMERLKLYTEDSHEEYNALPNLRPDGAHYPKGYPKTYCNVVMIFENKGYYHKNQNFSGEAIAQLLNGLRVLIDVQRRADYSKGGVGMAIGYLNNGVHIQFFELSHDTNNQQYRRQQTRVMSLNGIGGRVLINLLTIDDLALLGFCPPTLFYNSQKIKLLKLLGQGSFARVYRCSRGKDEATYVVKIFHPGKPSDVITTEENNLQKVNETFDKRFVEPEKKPNFVFTRLIGKCTGCKSNALLLSPEGKPFLRDVPQIRAAHLKLLCAEDLFEQNHLMASCQIFCALVDALQFLHVRCSLVHRDVKLSNFFLVKVSSNPSVDNTTVHLPVDAVVITNPLSLFTYHSDRKEMQSPSQRSGQRGQSRLTCRYYVQYTSHSYMF